MTQTEYSNQKESGTKVNRYVNTTLAAASYIIIFINANMFHGRAFSAIERILTS